MKMTEQREGKGDKEKKAKEREKGGKREMRERRLAPERHNTAESCVGHNQLEDQQVQVPRDVIKVTFSSP